MKKVRNLLLASMLVLPLAACDSNESEPDQLGEKVGDSSNDTQAAADVSDKQLENAFSSFGSSAEEDDESSSQ